MTTDYIHYEKNEDDKRRAMNSRARFRSGAWCGHGSAHCFLTKKELIVTCPECLKLLKAGTTGWNKLFQSEIEKEYGH